MELPEFIRNEVFASPPVRGKIPSFFDWAVELDERTSQLFVSADFKRFHGLSSYMRISSPEREEVFDKFIASYTFLLRTPRYRDMLDEYIGHPSIQLVAASVQSTLIMWSQLSTIPQNYLNDEDVINHFFGISPIPDEKLFALL